jgi:hypothetical protein
LEYYGSVLADTEVNISFHQDENPNQCDNSDYWYLEGYSDCRGVKDDTDDILDPNGFGGAPQRLVPYYATQPYLGTTMKVSELIWEISRGSLHNGCGSTDSSVCIDNTVNPINPAFVLTVIQKESGLVNGACSQPGADDDPGCWQSKHYPDKYNPLSSRMERIMGYMCLESSDPTKQCRDENPEWKYYKGVFRQMYYSMRWFKILSTRCDLGPNYAYKGMYTGNTVTIDGEPIYLKNGITCAMYLYTPHIYPDKTNTHSIFFDRYEGHLDFVEETGRDPDFEPLPAELF